MMIQPESHVFFGSVEQAVAGGVDPLFPPISVSRNASLAKWRNKLHFLDIRVNDPGLKQFDAPFQELLGKVAALNLEAFVTLPEYAVTLHPVPPDAWIEEPRPGPKKPGKKGREEKKPPPRETPPASIAEFRACYLAIPSSVADPDEFAHLSEDDCLPIMECAAKAGVKQIILPVAEPGLFLDPVAAQEFEAKLAGLAKAADGMQLKLSLRNGGMSDDLFSRWHKRFGCKLALNIGTAHLEQVDALEVYRTYRDDVFLLVAHQVLPGMDKVRARRKAMIQAQKTCLERLTALMQATDLPKTEIVELRSRFRGSFRKMRDAGFSHHANLGLFQSGDLNIVPLLKELRRDLERGVDRYILVESVPNTRNTDFIFQYLSKNEFPGAF